MRCIMKSNNVGQRYLDFLIDFTNPNKQDYTREINALFVPNIKKITNSRELSNNREELLNQINEAKQEFIGHTIEPTEIIINDLNRKICAIKFSITTVSNQKTYAVISLLFYNDQGFIEIIDEVYNEVGCWN